MDFELCAVLSQDVPLQQKFPPSVDKPKTFSINQQPEGKKRSISLPLLCMFINVHPFRGRHRVVKKAGPCTGEPNSRYGGRVIFKTVGGRVGVVVRALAFHQCGPGSISALGVKCGLSLLVLYSAMRGFPPGTSVFPSHQKPTFDLI